MAGDAKDGKGEWILNSQQMKNLTAQSGMQTIRVIGNTRLRGRDIDIAWQNEQGFKNRT
jgi:hypothetical protein